MKIDWRNEEELFESEESYLWGCVEFWRKKEERPEEKDFEAFLNSLNPVLVVGPACNPSTSIHVCVKCGEKVSAQNVCYRRGKKWCRVCKDNFFFCHKPKSYGKEYEEKFLKN